MTLITVTVILRPLLLDRGHITKQMSMFPGVQTQTQTKTFSAFYKMNVLTATASSLSVLSSACSMHVVRPQRQHCRQFVDMSAVWWGCHTTRHAVQIVQVYWRLVSARPRCTLACVQEEAKWF